MNKLLDDYESKMKKSVQHLAADYATLRVGRANPAVLDKVTVDYYGVPTPINQIGNVSVPEPKSLLIQPWDMASLKDIEKAILKSDLGITPNNDGKVIRLNFPPLTEERRKDLVKVVHKKAEESRVAVRSIRRDAIVHFKSDKKSSTITEDDLKDLEKDAQTLTDKYIKEIDKEMAKKEKEVMEI